MAARRLITLVFAAIALLSGAGGASAATTLDNLTVEHRSNPLGVDAAKPRFGWQMSSSERGERQTAYRILVATSPSRLTTGAADMWDSGRVASSDSVAVPYGGKALAPSTRYYWTVQAWDQDGTVVRPQSGAVFETALMSTDGKQGWNGAEWISMAGKQPNSPGAPMLRQQTVLAGGTVREARLYISALGVYDAYVNGERVGVPQDGGTAYELLAPGWTNYDMTVNYMTYDVTGLVSRAPRVTLGAVLGNGWYNGRISPSAKYYSSDGHPLALKAKLLIRFADGKTQTIVTKPGGGWKATDAGPYRADDIWDGQTYDARQEIPGWAANGFDDSKWAGVVEDDFTTRFPDSKLVAYPGETARLMSKWDRHPRSVTVYNGVAGEDSSPNGKGHIVVDGTRRALPVTIKPGETAIVDLGQNMVGVPRYSVQGPAGAEVQFKPGEMLNDTSAGADGPEGSVYRANLRAAKSTSTYVLRGDPDGETHQDSFAFYGFRYVSVTADKPVTITSLTGKVATSAIRDVGNIRTNDPLINRLFSNVRWGQRGNYLWVPTDCPQRDERQGWTGDAQLFSNTALYNADATSFLEAFQDMLIESQDIYGDTGAEFPPVAPGGFNAFLTDSGVSGWADAGVIVPWTVWQMSGDRTIVDRSWAAMTKYMDWIAQRGIGPFGGQGTITGDWLAFQRSSMQFISDAYYAYSTSLMAQMAHATGRAADAEKYDTLLGRIKTAFMAKYIEPDPIYGVKVKSGLGASSPLEMVFGGHPEYKAEDDGQTALLWVLKLGFYANETQRRQLVDLLAANIENTATYQQTHPTTSRQNFARDTLSVGFLGVNVLAPVLTDNGRTDLAYKLLHQDEMPSWLYSVKNGATTVWERWNSYSKKDGFGDVNMNSFNHYSYGAIAEWMYRDMAGIARDPASPGFKRFFLQPHVDPTGKITEVKGSYDSPLGEIVSSWSRSGDELRYHATVPANTSATLRIPAIAADAVRAGGGRFADAPGVVFLGFSQGVASYRLASGTYDLTSIVR